MERKVVKPRVKTLAAGKEYVVKQMSASAGDLLPKHLATVESLMMVHEGECVFMMEGEDHDMKAGDAIVVPANVKHQILAKSDFKGAHFMPKNIKFTFFN